MILIKNQILVFKRHFAHLKKEGERKKLGQILLREKGDEWVIFAP